MSTLSRTASITEMYRHKKLRRLAIKMGPFPRAKRDNRQAAEKVRVARSCIEEALAMLLTGGYQIPQDEFQYIAGALRRGIEECNEALRPRGL